MSQLIAKRLKEARKKSNLTQKQVGLKAGMEEDSASPRMNQYEKSKHTPDIATVERIAKALEIPAPYFYCEDDTLAELICLIGKLNEEKRHELLNSLRKEI